MSGRNVIPLREILQQLTVAKSYNINPNIPMRAAGHVGRHNGEDHDFTEKFYNPWMCNGVMLGYSVIYLMKRPILFSYREHIKHSRELFWIGRDESIADWVYEYGNGLINVRVDVELVDVVDLDTLIGVNCSEEDVPCAGAKQTPAVIETPLK